jgi:phosphocarrier protein HPr|tara:strand:- start:942 stop:1211 length:270 start_codon:yes stop_codon:yes gene_type:complete
MIKKKVFVKNKLGLHARASNKLVELTTKFSSDIFIEYNDKKVDAKSIMSILLLAASKGSELNLIIDGDDEKEASYLIEQLFNNYFEENE